MEELHPSTLEPGSSSGNDPARDDTVAVAAVGFRLTERQLESEEQSPSASVPSKQHASPIVSPVVRRATLANPIASSNQHSEVTTTTTTTTASSRLRRNSSHAALPAAKLKPLSQAWITASLSPTSSEFYLAFGSLGAPMVAAFLCSATSLFYMAFIQVFPTQVANFLMATDELDHGDFWLLSDQPTVLVVLSTLMLVVFGGCYVALVVVMLCFREWLLQHTITKIKSTTTHPKTSTQGKTQDQIRLWQRICKLVRTARQHWGFQAPVTQLSRRVGPRSPRQSSHANRHSFLHELTSLDGVYHAYFNAMFDLPKLAFQTASLGTYLVEGFPLPLIFFYVAMLMTNWCISFYRFQRHAADRNLVVTRLFYLFDLFFAVFAPIVVLGYAYMQFVMDRDVFAIREQTLSPGSYDRIARLFADPVQVDVFRHGFQHLQLTKPWYVAAKCCLNLLVVYKWKKIITFLVTQRHLTRSLAVQRHSSEVPAATAAPVATSQQRVEERTANKPQSRSPIRYSIFQRLVRVHGKRRHLVFGIVVFLVSMAAILTYVVVAITTSVRSCEQIKQCRVISYRWLAGSDGHGNACPCIVFIDRDLAPQTFHTWMNATDASQPLARAASSGHLKTVQIINRQVVELPVELRNCEEMEQLILIYTKTQELPDWVGEFHDLHYIHVESDFVNFPLHTLPHGLFARTRHLRFIRFGGAAALPVFPSLHGLHDLSTLVLSIPRNLTELPDLSSLSNLKTLIVADATHVRRLPSLQPLLKLTSFSLFRRNAMCCNGFLTGVCDLTHFQCRPRANEEPVTCEHSRLPEEDRLLLQRVDAFVCNLKLANDLVDSEPTELSTDGVCGGVRFQKCQLDGHNGMCYNGRMQVVHCDIFGEYEAMRRLEIAQAIGPPCDPQVEAWLGCT